MRLISAVLVVVVLCVAVFGGLAAADRFYLHVYYQPEPTPQPTTAPRSIPAAPTARPARWSSEKCGEILKNLVLAEKNVGPRSYTAEILKKEYDDHCY